VVGLPTRGQAGKWIAGVLAGLLVLAGFVAVRKPQEGSSAGDSAG